MLLMSWVLPGTAALDSQNITTVPANVTTDETTTPEIDLPGSIADAEDVAGLLIDKGIDCYNTGDYACTWASFEQAHTVLPNETGILYLYGYYLFQSKKYTESLEQIEAALVLEPTDAYLWYEHGVVLESAGRYTESGQSFDRARALDPGIEIPLVHRFPLNVVAKNVTVVVLIAGFCLLGAYIYFKERR